MEWTATHDVRLCKEMLAVNPFKVKPKTTQRTKYGKQLFTILSKLKNPPFKLQCELSETETPF